MISGNGQGFRAVTGSQDSHLVTEQPEGSRAVIWFQGYICYKDRRLSMTYISTTFKWIVKVSKTQFLCSVSVVRLWAAVEGEGAG